jgi:hypothetical protein
MGLEQSTIQDHFYVKGLQSNYLSVPQQDDEDRVHLVKGLKATKNEYNVALALDKLKFEYTFQMSVGSRGQAGTVILDFMVQTDPMPTPVWVHGEHWHMGDRRAKDLRNMATVDDFMQGAAAEPVELWGDETETVALALNAVRRELR